jgi:hypothetical protein
MRKRESYVRKYSKPPAEGGLGSVEAAERMYRNLQREAALASVHAQLKKRLAAQAEENSAAHRPPR